MPDPTKQGPDTPLAQVHSYLKSQDKGFTADLPTFEQDMQDDAVRKQVYDYLKGQDKSFSASFDEFTNDLGVKKKDGGIGSGTGAAPETGADPFNTSLQSNDVAAGIGEDVPAGTPMSAPAEVPTQPTGAAEQMQQPLGMMNPMQGGGGNFDNPEELARQSDAFQQQMRDEAGQRPEEGRIAPSFPQLTQQSADALAATGITSMQGMNPVALDQNRLVAPTPEVEDGFWSAIGKNIANTPAALVNAGGNALDFLGDFNEKYLTPATDTPDGKMFQSNFNAPVTDTKLSDELGRSMRSKSKELQLPISANAKKSVLDEPGNPAAWGNLFGQGIQSIAVIGASSVVGGPLAGGAAGGALSVSGVKDAAREAGIGDDEATATAVFVAPVVGVLEELGFGGILKAGPTNALLKRALLRKALEFGEGKVTKEAMAKAAAYLVPKIAARAAKGGAKEAVTEFLQGEVEGGSQYVADRLRSPNAPGKYGITAMDAFVKNPLEQAIGGFGPGAAMASVAGGSRSEAAPEQAPAVEAQPAPAEQTPTPEPQAAPAPVAQAVPTVRLKSGETLLADLDENGQAIRAYTEQGQEFSLENPDVKARIEQAAAVSLQEQQPNNQSDDQQTDVQQGPIDSPTEAQSTPDNAEGVGGTTDANAAPDGVLPQSLPIATTPVADPAVLDVTGQAEQLPAPTEQQAKTLSPQQQAQNDALDALDSYKQLDARARKGKAGAEARKDLAAMAKIAGLDFTVGNDFSASLTKGGKRVTRTNAVTATTPVEGHVPARQRSPEVRDAALTLAGRGEGISLIGLGVTINGKRLNPRDVKAAAKDILEGRNTLRADELLNTLERAAKEGYVEISTGNGLTTQKMRIPFEDYVGNPAPETAKSAQPTELSDADIDSLIAEDSAVQQAINDYADADGNIDYAKLAYDARDPQGGAAGLQFLFGINEDTATKLLALADERANQTNQPAERSQTGNVGQNDAGSQAQSVAGTGRIDEGSPATNSQEVAPKKPSLREQNVAAKQELSDALAEFRAARKKKTNKVFSSAVGFAPFSEEEAAAIVKAVKALVKLGYTNSKLVVAELRGIGWDEDDATDAQLLPAVRQVLKDEGVFKAKQKAKPAGTRRAAADERRTVVNQLNNPNISDERKARLESEVLRYQPKAQSQSQQEANDLLDGKTLAEAYDIALDAEEKLTPDVRLFVRERVADELDRLGMEADQAGNDVLAQQYVDQALAIDLSKAEENTEAGRLIAANRALDRYTGRGATYAARKIVATQAKEATAKVKATGKSVAREARAVQSEAVEATLNSAEVEALKQKLADKTGELEKVKRDLAAANKKLSSGEYDGKIKQLRDKRASLFDKLKKLNASAGIISPEQQRAELHVAIFYTYIDEGVLQVKKLVQRFKADAAKFGVDPNDPDLEAQAEQAIESKINDEQAKRLADRVLQLAAEKKPAKVKDPVQQMLDTLTAKVREYLPSSPSKPKASPREAIIHALQNQAEYADVWERAKEKAAADIEANDQLSGDEKTALMERLESFYAEAIGQAYATKQATQVVRQGVKELGLKLDDIVRRHVSGQDKSAATLVDKLVNEANLDPATAKEYAAVLEKEFRRQLAARRESIIARLTALRQRVGLGRKGKTALDKLVETLALAPVTDARVTQLLAEQTDIPSLTAADVTELRKLGEAVENAAEGRDKERAVRALNLRLSQIRGVKLMDFAQAVWYANVLSSYATHLVNFTANTYQSVTELVLATGRVAVAGGKVAAPAKGLVGGLKAGAKQAVDVLTTGNEPSGQPGKYEVPSTLEVAALNGNRLAQVLKYVPRLLKASDVFYQTGLREMRAWELASAEAAKEGRTDPSRKTWKAVYEKLANTSQRQADAAATATAEGRTGRDHALRVWELMEQSRPLSMREDTRTYATRAVFNGEMEGTLGVIFSTVTSGIERMGALKPLGKFVIPFSRVITNVANAYLDYTLHGFVRAAKGGIGTGDNKRVYTTEERGKIIAKATLGAAVWAALYAATHHDDEKDDLEISGPGPRDTDQRNQLLQQGWRPYAVKVGEKWVSYKESPLFFVIGTIGAMKDKEKYEKQKPDDDSMLNGASLLMLRTMGMVVETTATKNLSDFMDALTSSGSYGGESTARDNVGRYLERTAGYSLTGYVPFSGLLRQISRDTQDFMDLDKADAKGGWEVVQQDLPVFRSGLRPALDALGEPMKVQSDRLVSGRPSHRDSQTQELWDVLTEKGVGIPVPNQRTTVAYTFQMEGEGQLPADGNAAGKWGEVGPMSDETFYKFLQIRGALMKQVLLPNVAAFRAMKPQQAREAMSKLAEAVNKEAKKRLVYAKWPDKDRVWFKGF